MTELWRAFEIAKTNGLTTLLLKTLSYLSRMVVTILLSMGQPVLIIISVLVPRRDNLWIFGFHFGYADNSKYMFLYVNENVEEVTPVWIATDRTAVEAVRNLGYRAVYAHSVRGI